MNCIARSLRSLRRLVSGGKAKSARRRVAKHTKKTTRRSSRAAGRVFKTHDNGGRPYSVAVAADNVTITFNPSHDTLASKVERTPWTHTIAAPDHVWIGDNGEKCPHYEPKGKFKGSAILVRKGNVYTYIGENVRQFTLSSDVITAFYSPMGNSNVPYPYAIGTQAYLFIEKNKNSFASMTGLADRGNTSPYDILYKDMKKKDPRVKFIKCKYLHKFNR